MKGQHTRGRAPNIITGVATSGRDHVACDDIQYQSTASCVILLFYIDSTNSTQACNVKASHQKKGDYDSFCLFHHLFL